MYNLWAQFQIPVTLALGMINQCVGKAYEAIEYYKQVEKVTYCFLTNSIITFILIYFI